MSSFTTPLIVSPMPDGKTWKLYRSFQYHIGSKYSLDSINIPAGFITDFASIPRIFRVILPQWGKYGKAAVVHDYLYQHHDTHNTRKFADQIFHDAMIVSGTKMWKVKIMYWAVRLFGWLAWRKDVLVQKKD